MRVRLSPAASKAVRLAARREQRTPPKQASLLVLRGVEHIGRAVNVTAVPLKSDKRK